jgi:hypothetical protein
MPPAPRPWTLVWLGLALTAAVAVPPLFLEPQPAGFVAPWASPLAGWTSKAAVAAALALAVACGAWGRPGEPRAGAAAAALAAAALLMTALHYDWVDVPYRVWQRGMYLTVLRHGHAPPHTYRPLPYGFARSLEWLTGDWTFACLVYRAFFTFWFLWGAYRFARLFHGPGRALAAVAPAVLLYPLSIYYYAGQLTDPLSHALFMLALLAIAEGRWPELAAALALGVMAKETAAVLVVSYLACHWRRGLPALAQAAAVGAAAAAAFLAVRLPFGWQPGNEDANGLQGLMISTNLGTGPLAAKLGLGPWADRLGLGRPVAVSTVSTVQNYLHPLYFVGAFLPAVAWNWRRLDGRLRPLLLTAVPLLLLGNLCFGWMYESRNYMPLVPLLATAALPPRRAAASPAPGGAGGDAPATKAAPRGRARGAPPPPAARRPGKPRPRGSRKR